MLSRISFHVLYGRSHGHNNDRHGSDRRGGSDNHRNSNNNNYSGSNNRNSGYGRDQRNRGQQSNRSANSADPRGIREEFRNGFGPAQGWGKSQPVTIHTGLERFNKQKPNSFEKATVPV
nr:hypothetical protein [Tanacetum cinerariifolium]